jgi:hypothetical protein
LIHRSAEEAGAFVKKLQSLLRRIGSGDGDMEKVGQLAISVLSSKLTGVVRETFESMPTSLCTDPGRRSEQDPRSKI